MGAKRGHKKLGGRQKGGKNKNTLLLETFAVTIVEGGMERFQKELNKLSGKEYIKAYLTMFEYVKPKLARTEVKGDGVLKDVPLFPEIIVYTQTDKERIEKNITILK